MKSKQNIPSLLCGKSSATKDQLRKRPIIKENTKMELITSPWGLVITVLCIVALISLVIRFWNKSKKEVLYFEKLKPKDIFPTMRIPPKLNGQQEREPENDND